MYSLLSPNIFLRHNNIHIPRESKVSFALENMNLQCLCVILADVLASSNVSVFAVRYFFVSINRTDNDLAKSHPSTLDTKALFSF